ncbi:MAG: hypothetical protein IKP88_08075 [Lachnospiraceae bacterium]|nr:hypothetical protein [Lachnospiraceae bacterium]
MQLKNDKSVYGVKFCLYLIIVLCLFSLAGCASEDVYLNDAAEFFKQGNYTDAETSFLRAIRNGEKSITVFSGYAFNQLKAGDTKGAKALFELMINQNNTYGNYFDSEPATGEAVRRGLLKIYMEENDYEKALVMLRELGDTINDKTQSAQFKADAVALAWRLMNDSEETGKGTAKDPVYDTDELIKMITASIEAGNADVKSYRMRADLYWTKKEWDLWEADERKIIGLKDYAMDEYNYIYGMRLAEKSSTDVLSLVDEVVGYLNGHSSYIDDYSEILPMVLKAADISSRVEWDKDSNYYFDLAEKYIQAAENKNVSDNEILKFKIIVAERKGKMEVAYKLLGVYLEHCPDDRMAYKEQKYLENRIGISQDNP